jgi:hypothetical protein
MVRIDEIIARKMTRFPAIGDGMDVAITPMLQVGDPHTLIIKTAETLGANLLVIGVRSKRYKNIRRLP